MANVTDKSILTAAGKALLAQLNAEEKALVIDKMIFANVPNRPEYPQPDDVVPSNNVVHEAAVEQRGRLSVDSVIYSTTLTSQEGPFEFNWTGAYCSEYGVLVTIDHHALTPKTADEPGVAGNTLVRSVVLEYKDIAEITNITVDASTWQYNATPRMKKMDDDVAQSIIDQNGKDWFIEDGFLVTPQASAFNIKAGAGYVSGNRVMLEFDRNVQVPNKPSFIYVDAHREGTPTGEQVTLFDLVVTAEEKDDYTDANGVKHFVCKIAEVLVDGSIVDLRLDSATTELVGRLWKKGEKVTDPKKQYVFKSDSESPAYNQKYYAPNATPNTPITMGNTPVGDDNFLQFNGELSSIALSNNLKAESVVYLATGRVKDALLFVEPDLGEVYRSQHPLTGHITSINTENYPLIIEIDDTQYKLTKPKSVASHATGRNIYPGNENYAAKEGDIIPPEITSLWLTGGDFDEISLFDLISKDGLLFSASGDLKNINLTEKPYSCTIGDVDFWLCDPKYFTREHLSFRMFWAPTTGEDSDSSAIDAAIGCYPKIDFGVPVKAFKWDVPDVEYLLTKPIWCYELDQAIWTADRKVNIAIKDVLDVTRPQEFIDIEGDRGNTYKDIQSMFIFAARRRVQNPSQGFIGAGGAATNNLIENLFAQITGGAKNQVRFIYAPEFAGFQHKNCTVWGGFRGLESKDCYSSTFENIVYDSMYQPQKIEKGTSLVYTRVAAPRCNYGFDLKAQYSTMNSVTIDHWGRDASGDQLQNSFAYRLRGSGWVLNGCGCEFGYGGLFDFGEEGSATDVVINGGLFVGGALRKDPNYTGQKTAQDFGMHDGMDGLSRALNTQITWANGSLRQVVQPYDDRPTDYKRLPFEYRASNVVVTQMGRGHELQTYQYCDIRDWKLITTLDPGELQGYINIVSERDRPRVKAKLSENQIAGAAEGLIPIIFDDKSIDRFKNYNASTGRFIAAVPGYYKVQANLSIKDEVDTYWQYIAIQSSNSEETVLSSSNDTNSGANVTFVYDIYLNVGESVFLGIRTANTSGKATIEKSSTIQFIFAP